jgi:eukaryotic-like serine/threonine-protein kinase
LQVAGSPQEFGLIQFVANISCLYPTYVRGNSYLAAGHGSEAAVEFQTVIDHGGTVWNCWTGSMARLGLARAYALQARAGRGADAARVRSIAAYKDFLGFWKDADPNIRIFIAAKSEAERLR